MVVATSQPVDTSPVGGSATVHDDAMTGPDLAAVLLAAPAGVALVAALETEHRDDVHWWDSPPDSRLAAVCAASEAVAAMSFGDLIQRAVGAAERIGGPWMSDAPDQLARAFRWAPARAAIADAISTRFAAQLCAGFDPDAQQWWASAYDLSRVRPMFGDHRDVYCCGEFTSQGMWTVSDPPPEVHVDLIGVWELWPEPISRWRLPIVANARVRELHSPDDWVHLVAMYPYIHNRAHSGWELPGLNQHLAEIRDVEIASLGSAARHGVRIAMPDWPSIAADYDGIHLSWAGMLTSEGHVVPVPDLGPDVVTMLRYWRSERTLWLNDVFGAPEPLAAPSLSDREPDDLVVSALEDADRRTADERLLAALLDRDPFTTALSRRAAQRPERQT